MVARDNRNNDNNNNGDGDKLDELDSLLESLGGAAGDDSDDDEDDDNSYFDGEHMVDGIDPDAVDFTPFLQNHSGTAVNYHDESHANTEHHRLLHKKQAKLRELFQDDHESNDDHDMDDQESTLATRETQSLLRGGGSRRYKSSPSVGYTCIQILKSIRRGRIFSSSKSSKFHQDNEQDNFRYIVMGMLVFIVYVFLRHQTDTPQPVEPTVSAKASLGMHAPEDTIIPQDVEDAYVDIAELPIGIMDTPIYWHIPRSGGTTMKLIMSMCMGRVVACEQGAGHQLDEQLELLNKPFGNFANVDTSTPLGLQRAAELGLIPSRMVDVVLTPHVREATKLFDSHHKGRLFGLFRDPVERVVSLYYFLRMPDQEASVGLNVKEMSLAQFAADISENWMVRSLTNTMTGPLEQEHLHVAKEILRKKFLIGLLEEKTESLRRIENYFGWKLPSRVSQTCKNNMFYFEPQSKNIHDPIESTSEEYEILVNRNAFDIELYEYAKALFEDQRTLVGAT